MLQILYFFFFFEAGALSLDVFVFEPLRFDFLLFDNCAVDDADGVFGIYGSLEFLAHSQKRYFFFSLEVSCKNMCFCSLRSYSVYTWLLSLSLASEFVHSY